MLDVTRHVLKLWDTMVQLYNHPDKDIIPTADIIQTIAQEFERITGTNPVFEFRILYRVCDCENCRRPIDLDFGR